MRKVLCIYVLAMTLSSCQAVYVPQAREVKKKPLNGFFAEEQFLMEPTPEFLRPTSTVHQRLEARASGYDA